MVPPDQLGQPVRLAELQAIPVGQRDDLGELRRPGRGEVGHLTEEVLEPGRADHLDQGLTDTEAVNAMTGMVLALIPEPQAEPAL